METKESILRRVFGYAAFRGGQETLIDGELAGRDVFGVMPTGGGKTCAIRSRPCCCPA